jgi:hypothetical protein
MSELQESYDLVISLTNDELSDVLCQKFNSMKKTGRSDTATGKLRCVGDWGKYLFSVIDNRAQNFFNLVDIAVGMGGIPHKLVIASFSTWHQDILSEENSLMLKGNRRKRIHDSRLSLFADWEEPSLDEVVASLEYSYFHRDEIRRLGMKAGLDLKKYTWRKSAERLVQILY